MINNSQIELLLPEPQQNSELKADVLPSALLAQNPLLPAVVGTQTKYRTIVADPPWKYGVWGSGSEKMYSKGYTDHTSRPRPLPYPYMMYIWLFLLFSSLRGRRTFLDERPEC